MSLYGETLILGAVPSPLRKEEILGPREQPGHQAKQIAAHAFAQGFVNCTGCSSAKERRRNSRRPRRVYAAEVVKKELRAWACTRLHIDQHTRHIDDGNTLEDWNLPGTCVLERSIIETANGHFLVKKDITQDILDHARWSEARWPLEDGHQSLIGAVYGIRLLRNQDGRGPWAVSTTKVVEGAVCARVRCEANRVEAVYLQKPVRPGGAGDRNGTHGSIDHVEMVLGHISSSVRPRIPQQDTTTIAATATTTRVSKGTL
ncbi:hypothetical protein JOM56_000948 [Amanita muscaria]